jgi:hypothetical protein
LKHEWWDVPLVHEEKVAGERKPVIRYDDGGDSGGGGGDDDDSCVYNCEQ